ncbi:MAG: ion channel [Candidatus Binataceae bacterium]
MGYSNVRDYRGGLAEWAGSGEPLETTSVAETGTESPAQPTVGPPLLSEGALAGTGSARLTSAQRWNDGVLDLIGRMSTLRLFLIWIGAVLIASFGYWLGAVIGEHGLVERGVALGGDLNGLVDALYFSFVTATSVGYGDIVPIGFARVLAVMESVAALLIFGAVVAKFVSHRQDELVREIHQVTFDERLDRVQSNLYLVVSELTTLTSSCEAESQPVQHIATRLESAVLLFLAELRTTHGLLHQPRLMVQEGVLSSILANLSLALEGLRQLLACLPSGFTRSQALEIAISNVVRLAEDICGHCVPHEYTPRLVFWMDRIQATARQIR